MSKHKDNSNKSSLNKTSELTPKTTVHSQSTVIHQLKTLGMNKLLIIALTLVCFCIGGWALFYIKIKVLNEEQAKLKLEIAHAKLSIDDLTQISYKNQFINNQLTTHQNQQTQEFEQIQAKINRTNYELYQLKNTNPSYWKLLEAEFLIKLAMQRILSVYDYQGASSLLKEADSILKNLNDENSMVVREPLRKTIDSLEFTIDIPLCYMQLETLENQILRLQLIPMSISSSENTENQDSLSVFTKNSDTATLPSTFTEKLKNTLIRSWNNFSNLFRVSNHRDASIEALLSKEETQLIKLTLKALIEQCKLAVMLRNQETFDKCIQQINNYLDKYFMIANSDYQQLTTTIRQLKSKALIPDHSLLITTIEAFKLYQTQKQESIMKLMGVPDAIQKADNVQKDIDK